MSALKTCLVEAHGILTTRSFDADKSLLWQFYTQPQLIKQWMTGSVDSSLVGCQVDLRVGGTAHYLWNSLGRQTNLQINFTDIVAPDLLVYTERYDIFSDVDALVTVRFTQDGRHTLVSTFTRYESLFIRNLIFESGMHCWIEASYNNIDRLLASGN